VSYAVNSALGAAVEGTLAAESALPVRFHARARQGDDAALGYDRLMVVLLAWFTGGLFVDGWAHINLASLETFFTPWHGLFYSGFLATVAWLGVGIGRSRRAGQAGWRAIPAGYELSVIGAALFGLGGVADMLWHLTFGIEADVEALLSPTHLLLGSGMLLMLGGPARAAWRRADAGHLPRTWGAHLPMLLSLAYSLALVRFFAQYADPLSSAFAASAWRPLGTVVSTSGGHGLETAMLFQVPMLAGTILQSALLVGLLLLTLRHVRLPFGALTLLVGLTTGLLLLMRQRYDADVRGPVLLAVLLAGLAADGLLARLRPSFARPQHLRLLMAAVPALVSGASFAAVGLAGGLWWSIHLWAGAIFLAAVAGWLVALLGTSGPPARLGQD
jgi:hypothetical protein